MDFIREPISNEFGSYRSKSGLLTTLGLFYNELARRFVIIGDVKTAFCTMKPLSSYNIHRLNHNKFFHKCIHNWALYFMEELGVDKTSIIARTHEYLEVLIDKVRKSDPNSPVLPELIDKMNNTLNMVGGDWAELSHKQDNIMDIDNFLSPMQNMLPKSSNKVLIESHEEVDDAEEIGTMCEES